MNPILNAIHEGLPANEFTRPSTLRSAAVCKKSGMRPGEFCPESDIVTDWFTRDQLPSTTCGLHVEFEICTETGLLASEFCPVRERKVFLNRPPYIATDDRWPGRVGRIPEDAALMPPTETCDKHDFTTPPSGVTNFTAQQISLNGDILLKWTPTPNAGGWLTKVRKTVNFRLVLTDLGGKVYRSGISSRHLHYQIIAVDADGRISSGHDYCKCTQ